MPTSPWNYYLNVLRQYATFSGRARRAEFWYFALFSLLISIGLTILDRLIFGVNSEGHPRQVLAALYGLAVLIPGLAVTVRRLHDTDRSGWWWFICLIPFVGAIVLLVFEVLDSTPGPNRFGPNPKGL
jgi:uncharacterized membrane protein YhaH (DUF805 family)